MISKWKSLINKEKSVENDIWIVKKTAVATPNNATPPIITGKAPIEEPIVNVTVLTTVS